MKALFGFLIALLLFGTSYQTGVSSTVGSDPATPTDRSAATTFDAPLLSFSRLPAGHALLVRYRTAGCEHYFNVEFRFEGGSPLTVTATHIDTKWDRKSGRQVDIGRVPIGSMALSDDDARELDSLIAFYRTRPGAACDWADRISVRHIFKGTVFAAERFVDQSCILWGILDDIEEDEETGEMVEVVQQKIPTLTFWDLLQRFRNQWPDEMIGG